MLSKAILVIMPPSIALGPISMVPSCFLKYCCYYLTDQLSCAATAIRENKYIYGVPRIFFYIKLTFNEVCTHDNLCPGNCNQLYFHGIYLKVKCVLWAHFNLFPVLSILVPGYWCPLTSRVNQQHKYVGNIPKGSILIFFFRCKDDNQFLGEASY